MIPYALLMGTVTKDEKRISIRAIELYSDGLSFRLPRGIDPRGAEVSFSFLCFETYVYESCCLRNLTVTKLGHDKETDSVLWELHSPDQHFSFLCDRLRTEYLGYIDDRLNSGPDEWMARYAGIPMEDHYAASWEEQKMKWFSNLSPEEGYDLSGKEIGLSLDRSSLWMRYLDIAKEEFRKEFMETAGLTGHPLSKALPTHIYIGNAFCPLQFPDQLMLKRILEKAEREQLAPVIVFSTMAECDIPAVRSILQSLKSGTEVVVNDLGMLELIRKEGYQFKMTAGTLLNKRRKDSRRAYKKGAQPVGASIDAPFYREYLRSRYGVEAFSSECGGFEKDTEILHLPYYQMNTAGYCTMKAYIEHGDRAYLKENRNCPGYCEGNVFLYPEKLGMIGIGNSLFGFDREVLEKNERILTVRRIVIETISLQRYNKT